MLRANLEILPNNGANDMKEKDVPQKAGLSDEWHRISYATGHDGEYVLVESEGCDSVNITNAQAWDIIEQRIAEVHKLVQQGKLSPLAYHMAVRQMDEALLSEYSSFFKWQVKRHLKPQVFKKLSREKLQKYADVFEIEIEALVTLPELEGRVESNKFQE